MIWTAVKPDRPGWYWHRGAFPESHPIIVEVDEEGCFKWPDGSFDDVQATGGQWAGPLQPPAD
jgi:hypothetical protein